MNQVRPAQSEIGPGTVNLSSPSGEGDDAGTPVVKQSDRQCDALPRAFLTNVVCIGALGIAISAWILHYTDKFETAASLFALTGVFSWIAAVSKLLPSSRIDALQLAADRFVLNSWAFVVFVVIVGVGFLWWADGRGTIQIESRREITDRSVVLTEDGRPQGQLALEPGGHIRFNTATSRRAPREIVVKVSGYPDLRQHVWPWQRTALRVPSSFLRPVVLAKPSVDLIDQRGQGLKIVVKLNNRLVSEGGEFNGYAFWLGGDEDIEIPTGLQDAWHEELTRMQRVYSVRFWQSPVVLPGERFELKPQDQLCVEFQRPTDKSVYTRQDIVVRRLHDFPQVEEIHERDPQNPDPPHC